MGVCLPISLKSLCRFYSIWLSRWISGMKALTIQSRYMIGLRKDHGLRHAEKVRRMGRAAWYMLCWSSHCIRGWNCFHRDFPFDGTERLLRMDIGLRAFAPGTAVLGLTAFRDCACFDCLGCGLDDKVCYVNES